MKNGVGILLCAGIMCFLLLYSLSGTPDTESEGTAAERHIKLMEAANVSIQQLREINENVERIAKLLDRRGGQGSPSTVAVHEEQGGGFESPPEIAGASDQPTVAEDSTETAQDAEQTPSDAADLPQAESGVEGQGGTEPAPEATAEEAGSVTVPADQVEQVSDPESPVEPEDGPVYAIERGGSYGAAVAIGPNHLVTVRHIGTGRGRVRVGKEWYWCDISAARDGRDMAVVTFLGSPRLKSVQIGTPKFGQRVKLFSFNHKREYLGSVVSVGKAGEIALTPESDGVFPGDSGSGIFSEDGKLIGVVGGYINREHRHVEYAPITGVPLPKEVQDYSAPAPVVEGASKPKIWITQADFPCVPCEALKRSIAAGNFSGFEIEYLQPRSGIQRFPAIEYMDASGVRRVQYGFDSSTVEQMSQKAR